MHRVGRRSSASPSSRCWLVCRLAPTQELLHGGHMLSHLLLGKVSFHSGKMSSAEAQVGSRSIPLTTEREWGALQAFTHLIHHPFRSAHSHFQFLVCVFPWRPTPVPQYPFEAFPRCHLCHLSFPLSLQIPSLAECSGLC